MQPKDSRLKLEVEVANENALHWLEELRKANERNAALRTQLYKSRDLLRRANDLFTTSRDQLRPRNTNMDRVMDDLSADIKKLLEAE